MIWVLLKSVIKARKAGLMRLRPATQPTRLDCLAAACAKCCNTLGSPRVTPQEAQAIGPEHLCRIGDAIFTQSQGSTCSLLREGLCGIYPYRPSGCREYPWYNIHGQLYYDSGCPGIKYDLDERPQVGSIQPWENFFPHTGSIGRWILSKICLVR
ncbi:MAG: YkgJ family cysteine cluster protein [Phycisphaerae bacterium]|nr:YkgJ family cysteine cluster protein [Phycisphaerae bacterium]